ncbi:MAG TPA: retropepsin-like aspartic protease [Candidatus Acidoferrum sp.]|nr:retropepsin-like aspartic protease [Candidatus Acidoferrum sp.]
MRHTFPVSRIFLVAALFFGSHLDAQDPANAPVRPAVQFQLVSGFLVVVNGQVGELDGLKFIVDTGASFTLIDRKVADKLKLPRRPGKVTNFDRDAAVDWAVVPDLRIGSLRTGALRVMVAKLRDYSEYAENVDGVIGLDVLSRSNKLFIDYEKHSISWELAADRDLGNLSPMYFAIPFIVQGFPMRLIIDTGFQGILLYKDRLRKGLPEMQTQGEATEVDIGRLQTTRVKLPGVRLGGSQTVATVFLMDAPENGRPPGADGYLGIDSLKAKRVEFDFAGKMLRWE